MNRDNKLLAIYRALLGRCGNRHWWPAETAFEMMLGAILTQNVSWNNAALAIANLKEAGLLSPDGITSTPQERLAPLLRPARFMNLKARRLKSLVGWYASEFGADIGRMSRTGIWDLRSRLLEVDGIGEETADCILLYACGHPIFVVDSYTLRVFSRLGLVKGSPSYRELQSFFMKNLPRDTGLFRDYHAQVVHLAKEVCRKDPGCGRCPISRIEVGLRCKYYSSNDARRHQDKH